MPGKVNQGSLHCFIFFCLLLHSQLTVYSQDFTVLSVAPLDKPINTEAEELMPLMNKEGVLYFTRVFHEQNVGGKQAGSDIWSVRLHDRKKPSPSNDIRAWNNKENNSIIGIHKDGNTIYMLNAYRKEKGIAFSKKTNDEWIKPEFIVVPGLPSKGFIGYYMSPDYQFLLITMKGPDSLGEEDIYVSVKDQKGQWGVPRNLGSTINTGGFEISPFLASDNKTLYFASNGHDGLGDADIYMSQRLYDSWDVWSKPVNLGKEINSTGFDAYFAFYDSVAYLSSTRQGGLADIYKVSMISQNESARPLPYASADEVLFLTEQEIVELFGFIFEANIECEEGTATLSAKDKELLWFIANKIMREPAVKIALMGKQEGRGALQQKMSTIRNYLITLGIPDARIATGVKMPGVGKRIADDSVQLKFYKEN
jgi:hypothetical protein